MGVHHTVVLVRRAGRDGPVRVLRGVVAGWRLTLVPTGLVVLRGMRVGGILVVVALHARRPRKLMMRGCEVQPEESRLSDG